MCCIRQAHRLQMRTVRSKYDADNDIY